MVAPVLPELYKNTYLKHALLLTRCFDDSPGTLDTLGLVSSLDIIPGGALAPVAVSAIILISLLTRHLDTGLQGLAPGPGVNFFFVDDVLVGYLMANTFKGNLKKPIKHCQYWITKCCRMS